MHKLLISLLLASAVATPALADPPKDRDQSREERQQAREQRQQAREERQQAHGESQQARQRPSSEREQVNPAAPVSPQIHVRQQSVDRTDRGPVLERVKGNDKEAAGTARERRRDIADSVREWRGDERAQVREHRMEARDLRQSTRPLPKVMRTRVPVVSHVPREGTQPPVRAEGRSTPAPQWSASWRHNSKYDWYNWRKRHQSLFHLGLYYDPFGWGYTPYSIGWRMWPSFYSSRYWIDDAWRYRLPYAPPGYRWVRYWNDAILVDTWNGQVVDVIHNFFW
jgi:hypothetical protein